MNMLFIISLLMLKKYTYYYWSIRPLPRIIYLALWDREWYTLPVSESCISFSVPWIFSGYYRRVVIWPSCSTRNFRRPRLMAVEVEELEVSVVL